MSSVEVSLDDSVAIVRLNRPEARNAFDDAMREELVAVMDRIGRDPALRAIVLTGNGPGFCAGGDIKGMGERMKMPPGDLAFVGWNRMQRIHKAILALHQCAKPTIAAVNGAAAGLGADLAIACDFVVAADNAMLTWSYVQRGLIPDGGGMYFLPRRIGLARAKALIFTGRRVNAAEALELGIADRVAPAASLVADACDWARELGAHTGPALALAKQILDNTYESPLDEVLAKGGQAQAICYTTKEHQDAVRAFLEKRS